MPTAPDSQVRYVIEENCKHHKYPLSHIKYEGELMGKPLYTVYIKKGARRYKEIVDNITFAVRYLGIRISFQKNKEAK
jgi:hypothetical protein